MNKQVEALIERTKLTDEEHFYLHFATPYKCRSKEMDAYLRGLNDGAEAQQKKIFNDPKVCIKADDQSLPLITRERAELAVPDVDCSGRRYTPAEKEDNVRYVLEGALVQRDKDKFDSGWVRVIPPPEGKK